MAVPEAVEQSEEQERTRRRSVVPVPVPVPFPGFVILVRTSRELCFQYL